jgi:3-methylcrotonyl-CoA carboxylase alpha subunit
LEIRLGDKSVIARVDANAAIHIDATVFEVIAIGDKLYHVTDGARRWIVGVAAGPDGHWVFVDGRVARVEVIPLEDGPGGRLNSPSSRPSTAPGTGPSTSLGTRPSTSRRTSRRAKPDRTANHELAAPMPARVASVLVQSGQRVRHGETLIMLEAMKMELPVRAPRDAVVKAILCRTGDLVQPGVQLLELE